MKILFYGAVFAAVGMVCAFTNVPEAPKPPKHSALTDKKPGDALIKRGQYLVTIMGCGDCHSPKKMTAQGPAPDTDRWLSGYNGSQPLGDHDKTITKTGQWVLFNGQNTAFIGPWGVSFSANLTPDETGIGSWSLAQFTKAMRRGKYKGLDNSRSLLPPMPWPNYTQMTDADMQAVFTYLKSIKPVANAVPTSIPPIP